MAALVLGLAPAATPFDVLDSCFVIQTPGGSVGTGFLVESDLVATAAHVVEDARVVRLSTAAPDAQSFTGTVVFTDASLDVALVRLSADPGLASLTLKRELPTPGTTVFTIGSPIGELIASRGVVLRAEQSLIESNTPVDSGSSGGPLIDEAGEVRGLVVSQSAADGHAFSVPSSVIEQVIDAWREAGDQQVQAPSIWSPDPNLWPLTMWIPFGLAAAGLGVLGVIGIRKAIGPRKNLERIVIRMDEEHRNV